jgi:hypothetical protein
MEMMLNFVSHMLSPLRMLSLEVGHAALPIATALLFLLIGLWGCHLVRTSLDRLFKWVGVDDHARRIGLSTVLYRLGLGPSLGYLIGRCLIGCLSRVPDGRGGSGGI